MTHVGRDSPLMKRPRPAAIATACWPRSRKRVDDQLTQQRDHVLKEFSLDNKDGALARLVSELTTNHGDLSKDLQTKIDVVVKEFSLNDENSALSRLVQNVDRAQRTITNEFSLDNETSCLSRLKRELMRTAGHVRKEEPAVSGRGESLAGQDRHARGKKPSSRRGTA